MLIMLSASVLLSCNQDLTEEELAELNSKGMSVGDIVERSGTPMRAGSDPDDLKRQLDDAENRLRTGGGLFGKKCGLDLLNQNKQTASIGMGMPINPYLWKASLETINFMPLSSADPFAGLIITDWYSKNNTNERCKINIFIKGVELKTSNLKVNSFCQTLSDKNNWVSNETDIKINAQIENAILNKAKKLKLSTN